MTQQNPSYADWQPTLQRVMTYLVGKIEDYSRVCKERTGEPAYEHLIYRVKSIDSMNEKCVRKGLPVSARSALRELNDAIGIRIVCRLSMISIPTLRPSAAFLSAGSSRKKTISVT